MIESEKYASYDWIKVKRADAVEFDGVKYVLEEHHIAETAFLIDKVRELAKLIDVLRANLLHYQKQEQLRQAYSCRQARWEQDYLSYEDDRDRQ